MGMGGRGTRPAEGGVVGNVDIAGVGLAGRVERVGCRSREGEAGVIEGGDGGVGGIVLQKAALTV